MDGIFQDSRFSHIAKDSRFKWLPKKHGKVKVDKRFQSMFDDKQFHIKSKVDKRGRPFQADTSEDLKRYYALSDSESEGDSDIDEDSEEAEDADSNKKSEHKVKVQQEEGEVDDVIKPLEQDKKYLTADVKTKLKDLSIDYARGEGIILSDSSSDEESSDGEDSVTEFNHDWGELDKDADVTDDATCRLAICNMDWDRIKAADLMVLFHSFLPSGGLLHSVTIYPSDFGKERMKEEEEKGPIELTQGNPDDDEEDNTIQMEKLRQYQLNRLKYYYGVMVCDTKETANAIYTECDGLEYESSTNKLDLRFIPDDTTFDQEPRETCTSLPDLSTYRPRLFTTTALTQAKVQLTWDETDPNRQDIVKSIHSGKINEEHLKRYLACSSSEDEDEDEDKNKNGNDIEKDVCNNEALESEKTAIDKYKALLAEIDSSQQKNKKNEVNLEVTWNLKLENKTSEIIQDKNEKGGQTPFQQYLEKKREKKKKKKEERKAKIEKGERGSADSAFSDDDIPSDVDLNDPYFKEEMGDVGKRKKSKKKKKKYSDEEIDEETEQKKAELELLMLGGEDQRKHFSLKAIEENEKVKKKKFKKGKKRKADAKDAPVDDFKIDVNDERFSAVYSSHLFNLDPSDPQFKSTKATKELLDEKLRRRTEEPQPKLQKTEKTAQKKDAELSLLVKTIKRKTAEVQKKKKRPD